MTTTTTTTTTPSSDVSLPPFVVDITIYGATSFVANHVITYLTQRSVAGGFATTTRCSDTDNDSDSDHNKKKNEKDPNHIKITLGGRNQDKLMKLCTDWTNKMKNLKTISDSSTSKGSGSGGGESSSSSSCDGGGGCSYCMFDIFVANSNDMNALQEMCMRSKVILNCAGPYSKYSSMVVEACAITSTNYVDITGEVSWVKDMRTKYGPILEQEEHPKLSGSNKRKKARIISMCGFDSIPSDIAVYIAVRTLQQKHPILIRKNKNSSSRSRSCDTTTPKKYKIDIDEAITWHACQGFFNGGTLHTVAEMPIDIKSCFFRWGIPWFFDDPLALVYPNDPNFKDDDETTTNAVRNRFALSEWYNQLPSFDVAFRYGISIPFFMCVVNSKVVHASAIALQYNASTSTSNFRYKERFLPLGYKMTTHLSLLSIIPAFITQISILMGLLSLYIPIIRTFILNQYPPGTGMSDRACSEGYGSVYAEVSGSQITSTTTSTETETTNTNTASKEEEEEEDDETKFKEDENTNTLYKANCMLQFRGDPGNWITAQCVSESALSLAYNQEQLPKCSPDGFGTPAQLLGDVLVNRLQTTKIRPVQMNTNIIIS